LIGLGGHFALLQRVEHLVKMIKEARPDLKIVLGGMMVTYCPELTLKKTGADFGIRGEGELALLRLIEHIENNLDYSSISGLVYWKDGEVIENGFADRIDFSDLPLPNWDKLPMYLYITDPFRRNDENPDSTTFYWMISRGCLGKCNFCTPGGKPRFKRVDQVISEIRQIKERFNPTTIFFCDNIIAPNKKYLMEFCNGLLRENLRFNSMSLSLRVDMVNKEALRLLRMVGCRWIGFGLESANNQVLKFMGKNITVEQVLYAVNLAKSEGISPVISGMFGQPGETLKDFLNTIRVHLKASDNLLPHNNHHPCIGPIRTYPGSPLYQYAIKHRYIKDDEDYYDKFFNTDTRTQGYRGWINYTKYSTETINKVTGISKMLMKRQYFRNAKRNIENRLFSMWNNMQVEDMPNIPDAKLEKLFDRELKGKRVVLYGISILAEHVVGMLCRRNDIELVALADGFRTGYLKNNEITFPIMRLNELSTEDYDIVAICVRKLPVEDEIYSDIYNLCTIHNKKIVRILSSLLAFNESNEEDEEDEETEVLELLNEVISSFV
jgi:anaerobic magnesium-protoporphyrin IX monomethyl ester cyclase